MRVGASSSAVIERVRLQQEPVEHVLHDELQPHARVASASGVVARLQQEPVEHVLHDELQPQARVSATSSVEATLQPQEPVEQELHDELQPHARVDASSSACIDRQHGLQPLLLQQPVEVLQQDVLQHEEPQVVLQQDLLRVSQRMLSAVCSIKFLIFLLSSLLKLSIYNATVSSAFFDVIYSYLTA